MNAKVEKTVGETVTALTRTFEILAITPGGVYIGNRFEGLVNWPEVYYLNDNELMQLKQLQGAK